MTPAEAERIREEVLALDAPITTEDFETIRARVRAENRTLGLRKAETIGRWVFEKKSATRQRWRWKKWRDPKGRIEAFETLTDEQPLPVGRAVREVVREPREEYRIGGFSGILDLFREDEGIQKHLSSPRGRCESCDELTEDHCGGMWHPDAPPHNVIWLCLFCACPICGIPQTAQKTEVSATSPGELDMYPHVQERKQRSRDIKDNTNINSLTAPGLACEPCGVGQGTADDVADEGCLSGSQPDLGKQDRVGRKKGTASSTCSR